MANYSQIRMYLPVASKLSWVKPSISPGLQAITPVITVNSPGQDILIKRY